MLMKPNKPKPQKVLSHFADQADLIAEYVEDETQTPGAGVYHHTPLTVARSPKFETLNTTNRHRTVCSGLGKKEAVVKKVNKTTTVRYVRAHSCGESH